MPLYDTENFDKSIIPNHFKADVRECMEIAVMLGWKLHVTGAQSVTIIAPEERKKYHFGRRNTTPLNRIRKDIVKYADPEKLVAAEILKQAGPGSPIAVAAAEVMGSIDDGVSVVDARPETEEPKPRAKPRKSDIPVSSGNKEAYVVSEKPMTAKASEGKGYDSKVALERKWSDGTTDYKCVDCDFSSPNRLSIRGHYASHKKGRNERPPAYAAEVPNAATYAPNKNRVAALAQALIETAGGVCIEAGTATDVARTALMWVHEQSKRSTEHAEEREPMTAEDTLNRIRTLLDDGSRLAERQRIEELEQRIVAAEERAEQDRKMVEEAQAHAAAMEAKAEAARSTLKAFTDLASELTEQAG